MNLYFSPFPKLPSTWTKKQLDERRNETPDYVLLLQEPPPLFIDKSLSGDMGAYDFYPMPRSSLHSVRKASYDVRSVGSDGTPFWIYYQSVYWPCCCCCVYIFIICRNTHQQMFWLDGNRGHHKAPESGEATLDGHRRTHHQSDQHHHGCSRVQSQLHLTGSGQGT